MAMDFYALPDEQRLWLWNLISEENLLCAFYRMSSGKIERGSITDRGILAHVDFCVTEISNIQFFVGKPEFLGQAYSQDRFLQEVEDNFTRLQAIRITASRIVADRILLDGQIAIMRPIYYVEASIDPKPVQKWYQQVKRSFKAIMTKDFIVTQRTTLGTVKEWKEIGITPGGVEWRLSGKLLKQFPKGPVEFDVMKKR